MVGQVEPQGASQVPDSIRGLVGPIRAECFLLCNGVEAVGGKLFILGGGWDRLIVPQFPTDHVLSVAVKLAVPTTESYRPLPLHLEIVDDNGHPALPEPMRAELQMARPLGYEANETLPFFLPITVKLHIERPERYTFRLYVEDHQIAQTSFRAIPPPAPATRH